MTPIHSRPYCPDPEKCCEGCCFGGDNHEPWCPVYPFNMVTWTEVSVDEAVRRGPDHCFKMEGRLDGMWLDGAARMADELRACRLRHAEAQT